jgi:Na+/proline symporter
MSTLDWVILLSTLAFIVVYGIYKSRGNTDIQGYLLGNKSMKWYMVGFSVMATQASAITFLSAPGQAYTDGMRFVQFYFGLPLAMIVLCISVIPVFHRMKVYTAYEYLENRFDLKTRALGAFLFLIQRGIAAGLTIYAPAIILSSLLGWNIYLTNIFIGGLVIIYTVSGGTRAVSYTQLGQMIIILSGMGLAGYLLVQMLPQDVSFMNAVEVAGKLGKMNVVDLEFDPDNRYNLWSGLIGGFFLALSYFGTDQSQVARYLSGRSISEIRLGMLFNGIVKIPMQFSILLIGAIMFVFFQFNTPPVFFNGTEIEKARHGAYADEFGSIEKKWDDLQEVKRAHVHSLAEGIRKNDKEIIISQQLKISQLNSEVAAVRERAIGTIVKNNPAADTNDTNYIFLTYVINYLPAGVIGLLIAVIFAASMSSTSSELNALASTSLVDIYKRMIRKDGSDRHYLVASKLITVVWGLYAIMVAQFANQLGSLIEAVNILGSLFYGTILGIFVAGFYFKKLGGHAVFGGAVIAESFVVAGYLFTDISFLWFNLIGCFLVVFFGFMIQQLLNNKKAGQI